MDKYKKFKVGDYVKLKVPVKTDLDHFEVGTNFVIKSFPPCVFKGKYLYFVYGKTEEGKSVRCDINEIKKVNRNGKSNSGKL